MTPLPLAVFTLSLSGAVFAATLPITQAPILQAQQPKVTKVVKKAKVATLPRVHVAKSKLFKQLSTLEVKHGVDDNYDDDSDDEITIQSITRLKITKKSGAEYELTDSTAERLAMIKWIVLAKTAKLFSHKV